MGTALKSQQTKKRIESLYSENSHYKIGWLLNGQNIPNCPISFTIRRRKCSNGIVSP